MVGAIDVRECLPRLRVSCLYLQASGDVLVPPSALSDFVAAVPGLRIARVKGPHFILQARSREPIETIEAFTRVATGEGT